MRWNCPHCSTALAISDEKLGNGWSFSRCYKCAGFALVRRNEAKIVAQAAQMVSPLIPKFPERAPSLPAFASPSPAATHSVTADQVLEQLRVQTAAHSAAAVPAMMNREATEHLKHFASAQPKIRPAKSGVTTATSSAATPAVSKSPRLPLASEVQALPLPPPKIPLAASSGQGGPIPPRFTPKATPQPSAQQLLAQDVIRQPSAIRLENVQPPIQPFRAVAVNSAQIPASAANPVRPKAPTAVPSAPISVLKTADASQPAPASTPARVPTAAVTTHTTPAGSSPRFSAASGTRVPTPAKVTAAKLAAAAPPMVEASTAFPEAMPEVPVKTRSQKLIRWALAATGVSSIASGLYLYSEGQALWNQARARQAANFHEAPTLALNTLKSSSLPQLSSQLSGPPMTTATKPDLSDRVSRHAMAPERAPAIATGKLMIEVTKDKVALRAGPGVNYKVVSRADSRFQYGVAEWKGEWFKVQLEETNVGEMPTYAWIRNDFAHLVTD